MSRDPSQDTKVDLTEAGIACLLEFGQAARFLLKNSDLQDNLQKTARNFVQCDKTIETTYAMMAKLSDLTSELKEHSGQIAACLETLPKISSSLEECHAIARGRKSNSLSDNYTIKSRPLADEDQTETSETISPEGSFNKL